MKDSDPGLSVVFIRRPKSNFNSVVSIQATGRNFQYGSNFCVSLDPSFSFVMIRRFLEECIHDEPSRIIVFHCLLTWNAVQFQQLV